jgi:Leucine-rich repeat (LRR) protein
MNCSNIDNAENSNRHNNDYDNHDYDNDYSEDDYIQKTGGCICPVPSEGPNYAIRSKNLKSTNIGRRTINIDLEEFVENDTNFDKVEHFGMSNNYNIRDISFISRYNNITSICIYDVQISDISPFRFLENLTSVEIYKCPINNAASLSSSRNLRTLILGKTEISDIDFISGMMNLGSLTIEDSNIVDINAVGNLQNLKYLNLSKNSITEISPISNLINLEYLDLSNNRVSDVRCLSRLHKLKNLDISNTQVSSIRSMRNMNISYLTINNMQILSAELAEIGFLHSYCVPNLDPDTEEEVITLIGKTEEERIKQEHDALNTFMNDDSFNYDKLQEFIKVVETIKSNTYMQIIKCCHDDGDNNEKIEKMLEDINKLGDMSESLNYQRKILRLEINEISKLETLSIIDMINILSEME